MNCRNCGAPIEPGANFCRKCGTDVPRTPEQKPRVSIRSLYERYLQPLLKNKRLMMIVGGAAALLLVLILILSIASCADKKLRTPDEVANAVLRALEDGDGDTLLKMASLSEEVCGAHPELFGEGKNAHAVMQNYYRTLAGSHYAQWKETYGKRFSLDAQLETELLTLSPLYSGTSLYEINRALEIDATQYAVISGPLSINGEPVGTISMTAVEWDGEWQLLIVYVY